MPANTQEAIKKAYEYLLEALKATAGPSERPSSFRVEELKESPKGFSITLSYEMVGDFPFDRKREYKNFELNKDAKVLSMSIRP